MLDVDYLKKVLKNYFDLLVITTVPNFLALLLAFAASSITWLDENEKLKNSAITYTTVIFFISGLALFATVHFISLYGFSKGFKSKFYFFVIGSLFIFLIPLYVYLAGYTTIFYYYYLDTLVLVVTYLSLCCAFGYCGVSRVIHRIELVVTELIVCAFSLAYGMLLMTVFMALPTDTTRLIWRVFIYPLYFEVAVMIPVRWLIRRRMSKSTNVMRVLAVVHAEVHLSTMGKLMMASFESHWQLFISALLLCIGKLFVRASITYRDRLVASVLAKLLPKSATKKVHPLPKPANIILVVSDSKTEPTQPTVFAGSDLSTIEVLDYEEQEKELAYSISEISQTSSVSAECEEIPTTITVDTPTDIEQDPSNFVTVVLIYTEMFCDMASIVIAALSLKFMGPHMKAFNMMPLRNDSYIDVLIIITIQVVVAIPFDIVSIYWLEKQFKLQMLYVWEMIMQKRYQFFGFLIYGLLTMGMLGAFWMTLKMPRVAFCSSHDHCSCWGYNYDTYCK